jgi:hypothetical protein
MNHPTNDWRVRMALEHFFRWNSFGLTFLVVAFVLVFWFGYLMRRPCRLSDCFAFLAAAFFPSCLGVFGAAVTWAQELFRSTWAGGGPGSYPGVPAWVETANEEFCLCLITGISLTCLFVPLSVVAILVRRPK